MASKNLVLNGKNSTDFSNCLSNCRKALEAISGNAGFKRFKEYVSSLQINKSKKKTLNETYNYLSGYGSHYKEGGVTRNEMETGFHLTLGSITILKDELRKG